MLFRSVAISSVCFDFITGRYHVPINMPKKDVDAAQILGAGGFFVFFTTVILLFVALLVTIFVSPTGKLEEIFPFLFLIPIAAMCKGVNDLMTSWHVRKGKYGVVSTSRILQSVITCLGQLGLAIFGVKSAGLIWGRFMGEFVGIVFFVLMFSLVYRSFFKEIRLEKVVGSLKRYKDFLFYETPLTVFKSVSSYTPLFLLTHYYSLEVTGFYTLATRFISIPFSILQISINQVFYQEICEIYSQKGDLYSFVLSKTRKLAIFVFGPHLLIFLVSPIAFKIIFGEGWEVSGVMTRFLVPYLFLQFINSPLTALSHVLNKQKPLLMFEVAQFLMIFFLMLVSYYYFHSYFYMIAAIGFGGFLFQCFLLMYLLNCSKNCYEKEVYSL